MINNYIDIHFDGDSNEDQVNQYPDDDRLIDNDNDDDHKQIGKISTTSFPTLHNSKM